MRRTLLLALLVVVAMATVGAQIALADVPTIGSFAPASGPPAWVVTLTGAGFTGTTDVTFTPTDPSYAPEQAIFTAQDDTTIVATVPFFDTVPLAVAITVDTSGGSVTTADDFGVDGQVALSESRGSSGETITLTGSGFTGATGVNFGTWPTQSEGSFVLANPKSARFRVVSDTEITATVPALTAGRRCSVKVVGPAATSVTDQSSRFLVVRPRLLRNVEGSFAIRPATIVPSGDGAFNIGMLGGHLRWRVWRTARAYGLGTVWIDNGIPNMALGTFHGYAGSVTATRVRGGKYTRMTVRWRQKGRKKTAVLKLAHNTYGWWWN